MLPSDTDFLNLAPWERYAYWRTIIDLIEERLSLIPAEDLVKDQERSAVAEQVAQLRRDLERAYEQIGMARAAMAMSA